MPRAEKRFMLNRVMQDEQESYIITDNGEKEEILSQWVMCKSIRKISTGKEYGGKLVFFLNYLADKGIRYADANNETIKRFVQYAIYADRDNPDCISATPVITYNTLSLYITVITDFYKWLDNNFESNMKFVEKTDTRYVKKSFLYGQIYSQDYKYLIDRQIPVMKQSREYIKWYTDEEKTLLCNNFRSLRDEAVFRLTLEGFRIDEVLSMELGSYDSMKHLIQPMRSKGRMSAMAYNKNTLRIVALPNETCEIIDRYISEERCAAENTSGIINQSLFINTKKGPDFGQPLAYRNYLKILKRCAKRAGIPPERIRTHSGRSTKVMEFVEHQIKHPEDGITDAIIMECFGWRNIDSIQPYKNHNNPAIAIEIMKKLHKENGND